MLDKKGVFICHSTADSSFVISVAKHLKHSFDEVFYFEDYQRADQSFITTLDEAQKRCTYFVVFVNSNNILTTWQQGEIGTALKSNPPRKAFVVYLGPEPENKPVGLSGYDTYPTCYNNNIDSTSSYKVAHNILEGFQLPFKGSDGLPFDPNLFSYEKDIIDFYSQISINGNKIFTVLDNFLNYDNDQKQLDYLKDVETIKSESTKSIREDNLFKNIEEIRRKLLDGCPAEWPEVICWTHLEDDIPPSQACQPLDQNTFGSYRDSKAHVLAATLSKYHSGNLSGHPTDSLCLEQKKIFFPEAGPRENIYFPKPNHPNVKVAILVAGGIAPGINAVIDGIVQRHSLYARENNYEAIIVGIKNGLYAVDFDHDAGALLNDTQITLLPRRGINSQGDHGKSYITSEYASTGGSILGTSRVDELIKSDDREDKLKKIYQAFQGFDLLYIIGGDGSMKLAHAIWKCSNIDPTGTDLKRLSVVAIPKTMDNDILWMWQSFGFLSAVEKAREIIGQLDTEIKSNPRLCVLQLFGSDSGFVVSHAVAACSSGQCDVALIPEVPFSLYKVADFLKMRMSRNRQKVPSGLVVMAETAIPTDAICFIFRDMDILRNLKTPKKRDLLGKEDKKIIEDDILTMNGKMKEKVVRQQSELAEHINLSNEELYEICNYHLMRKNGRHIQGQTNDELRSATLKIVSKGLEKLLPIVPNYEINQPNWNILRVMTNEPRHILRAINPTSSDIIMGQRLGTLAVDNAIAGYTDFMISQWLTEFVLVPLELVVLGRKRIPQYGMFWKSVLAKTEQDSNLDLFEHNPNQE